MELRAARVDPHVVEPHHQEWIARELHACHVERGRQLLVGDLHIDVLQCDDVARIVARAIE